MKKYTPHPIESKWRDRWHKERKSYELKPGAEKYYTLDMISYPSSEGLHMGHWRPYTIADTWARYQTMLGKQVLHPVGFDAFGLPAENAAIKNQTHPAIYTKNSIANFSRQIEDMGKMYDWSTLINTSDPDYYKWTQWIFLQLYKNGLAYRKDALANWCPSCQTVLANEQVVDGRCERCKSEVDKKHLKQWFLKITDFAEDLLNFDGLNWPDRVKTLQTNWIGKSEGVYIDFPLEDASKTITVFTKYPETVFGVTYMVLAPEHPLVAELTTEENKAVVRAYQEQAKRTTEIERAAEDKTKTGVFTGGYCINPVNGEQVPVWIADYVLMHFGTGAVMGVPAHDTRDFLFAQAYNLPVKRVIGTDAGDNRPVATVDDVIENGIVINSGELNGLVAHEAAAQQTIDWLERKGYGKRGKTYRLRDWLVSRQRYWGAPIPIIYCDKCGEQPVPEADLPVQLPDDAEFMPTGGSPLERHERFKQVACPACGGTATRETDTLDTFVDSSWYYLRFTDPRNADAPFSKEQADKWMPVDFYVGGTEHSILHLLYARFIMKALHRLGHVAHHEPFQTFYGNGMVYLHGSKMSKSKGNIVNPDEIVKRYGTDAMRGYILFMGPADQDVEWQENGITGVSRFIEKAWELFSNVDTASTATDYTDPVKKAYLGIQELLPQFAFNRCISTLMIAINELSSQKLSRTDAEVLIKLFAPFFPHFAEEVWERLGYESSIFTAEWPHFDVKLTSPDIYAVQVNGKLRATIEVTKGTEQAEVESLAHQSVTEHLTGKNVVKTVYVPGRIVNFVVQ